MELREFVKRALSDLVAAVEEASSDAKARGSTAVISPRLQPYGNWVGMRVAEEDGGGMNFLVDFDLSVEVTESTKMAGKAGGELKIAHVLSVGAGGASEAAQATVATQRLRFSVPIKYPQTEQCAHSPRTARK